MRIAEDQFEWDLARKICLKFESLALSQGENFKRRVIHEARSQGLPDQYLQYLLWLVVERSRDWPSEIASNGRSMLILARDLMVRSDIVPKYHIGFSVPEGGYEGLADMILIRLSLWAQSTLLAFLKRDLLITISEQKEVMSRRMRGALQGKTLVYLYALVTEASQDANSFMYPDLMQALMPFVL